MHYRFPYVGTDLRKLALQSNTRTALQDHRYRLVYHAVYLFIPPAFAGYSTFPTHRGMTQAE